MSLRSCLRRPVITVLFAALLLVQAAGCAMIDREEMEDTEQLLSAGGFSIKAADAPDKLAKLQQMKQGKMIRRQGPDGQPEFLFADAAYCRCLFVGNEAAYQKYQRLAVQQQIATTNQQAELDASMNAPWAYDWWSY
jgi:hypothetical protein